MTTDACLNIPPETLDKIVDLAQEAVSAEGRIKFVNIPNDPDGRFAIVKSDGSFEIQYPTARERKLTLKSIDQLTPFVTHAIDKWQADPAVYYHQKGAVAVLDESQLLLGRGGTATVALTESTQLGLLRKFAGDHNSAWYGHKAFVLLLRIQLEDCINFDQLDRLVRSLAEVQFKNNEKGNSSVLRGRESLGSEVLSELTSLSDVDIPEQVILTVRMFTDPALVARRQIVCKLETDPVQGKLALLPLANELENAMDAEMTDLGEMLRNSINSRPTAITDAKAKAVDKPPARPYVPVFYGTP